MLTGDGDVDGDGDGDVVNARQIHAWIQIWGPL